MEIKFSKKFEKQFSKLTKKDKNLVEIAIRKFMANPKDLSLRNHKLKGKLCDLNSIDAAFDLRILFSEEKNYTIILFLKVGTHSELYD